MVVDADRLSFEDGFGEFKIGHVGATPGAIDSKKTQANGFEPIEMAIGVCHQFIRLFGGRIETNGIVDVGRFLKGEFAVVSVYRRTGSIDEAPHIVMPASFQYMQKADDVGFDVFVGMVEGVAHACLSS